VSLEGGDLNEKMFIASFISVYGQVDSENL